jgi:hypothetical protein
MGTGKLHSISSKMIDHWRSTFWIAAGLGLSRSGAGYWDYRKPCAARPLAFYIRIMAMTPGSDMSSLHGIGWIRRFITRLMSLPITVPRSTYKMQTPRWWLNQRGVDVVIGRSSACGNLQFHSDVQFDFIPVEEHEVTDLVIGNPAQLRPIAKRPD